MGTCMVFNGHMYDISTVGGTNGRNGIYDRTGGLGLMLQWRACSDLAIIFAAEYIVFRCHSLNSSQESGITARC